METSAGERTTLRGHVQTDAPAATDTRQTRSTRHDARDSSTEPEGRPDIVAHEPRASSAAPLGASRPWSIARRRRAVTRARCGAKPRAWVGNSVQTRSMTGDGQRNPTLTKFRTRWQTSASAQGRGRLVLGEGISSVSMRRRAPRSTRRSTATMTAHRATLQPLRVVLMLNDAPAR